MALSRPVVAPVRKPLPALPPRWRSYVIGYGLALPAIALVLGMFAYPLIYELQLSLTNAQTTVDTSDFIGLRNYARILTDVRFWQAIRNTAFLVVITTCGEVLLGVTVALLLWRRAWLRPMLFFTVFLPWIYPSTFANYTWYWMILPPFHTFYTLDVIQARFWLEGVFGEQSWQVLSFAIVCVWRGSSILAIVLLAGFRAIPRDLLDSARLDTSNPLRLFWWVVVPLARRFIVLGVVVALTVAYLDYLALYLESNGRITVPVLGTLVYQSQMIDGQTGYAAALSMLQLPVIAALALVALPLLEAHISRWTIREEVSPPHVEEAALSAKRGISKGAEHPLTPGGTRLGGAAAIARVGLGSALRSLACLAIGTFYLVPLYYTAVQMVKSQKDFIKPPLGQPFWVSRFDITDGVLDTLRSAVFWRAGLVTLVVFGSVILIGIIAALLAGYALARLRLPGSNLLARLLFVTYFIPQLAVIVPLLQLFASVGLQNTLVGLILLYLTLTIPFATWLFYTYFQVLDPEAEEHALLDATRLRAFLSVVLPRTWPVIVAAAVFAIGMMSSDLVYGRIFSVSSATRTLPMTAGSVVYDPDNWADANGAILLGALPLLVVALGLGSLFVRGLQSAFSESD